MSAPANSVTLIGSKGGPAIYPGVPRMPTSTLVRLGGQSVVIDCGLGVTRGLVDAGMALRDLAAVIVTHLHSDHYLEFGPLMHTAWTAGLKRPVAVFGPVGLAACWQAFVESMAFDITTRMADEGRPDLAALVRLEAMDEGLFARIGDVRVSGLLNRHPPITESYALKLAAGGKVVVLSGDTAPFDSLADFARGADLLIHEAMIGEGIDRLVARVGNGDRLGQHLRASHTEARDVGRLAARADVKALALNHLIPVDDPAIGSGDWERAVRAGGYEGLLHVGEDGVVIGI
ncbi:MULTISPECIES: MBL fold metallo-hydrolase [unclassified Roseitalea]|uniref:MBL fold metallo-hydrolase n=1 Tax=unclassified Roseitalea TaxID=2639107 RepID=UPI00273FB61E|nr:MULTISPECIES: MBL fold metallo-hydrolase [unclassified Roseitalea]